MTILKKVLFYRRRFSVLSWTMRLLILLSLAIVLMLINFHEALRVKLRRKSGTRACQMPSLDVNHPDIMKLFRVDSAVKCESEENWVKLRAGVFVIKESAAQKHPDINCSLMNIKRTTDFENTWGNAKEVKNGTKVDKDFYYVHCVSRDGSSYRNYHASASPIPDVEQRQMASHGLNLDVVILGVDSTSRMMWHRKLKKTRDYFINILNGTEFEGYNIVGDGTPAALLPILTGMREEELPEARRGSPNASIVDLFPWIWKNYTQAGYVTSWAEEQPGVGTFQLRLLGFREQPVDHYYRPFTPAFYSSPLTQSYLGSTPKSTALLEYTGDVFYAYPGTRRKWMFGFLSELSHMTTKGLAQLDKEMSEYIKRLHFEKHLDNALFILMSDHGARFQVVRDTEQGKLEERLPYLGIRVPEWFRKKYPQVVRNIQTNAKRLTTPFDVYETLVEILHFSGSEKGDVSKRGISLFKEVPEDRQCSDADIDPHWCVCFHWKPVPLRSPIVTRLSKDILSTINSFTEGSRNVCALLEIDDVISVSLMEVNDDVLKFIRTNDGGRGRFGEMATSISHTLAYYQVKFETTPGGGKFEVTVTHNLANDVITLDSKDISRINMYGHASHCIVDTIPFLRPYCYCKDLLH